MLLSFFLSFSHRNSQSLSLFLFHARIPGVNFTNVLGAAFMHTDPKSAIKLLNLTVFLALLGSSGVKAARRMLVKLTPCLLFLQYFHSYYFSSSRTHTRTHVQRDGKVNIIYSFYGHSYCNDPLWVDKRVLN